MFGVFLLVWGVSFVCYCSWSLRNLLVYVVKGNSSCYVDCPSPHWTLGDTRVSDHNNGDVVCKHWGLRGKRSVVK
ncbi:hypothetical protein F5H01DRAFT_348121 [Linnemannia elongata]|nr:hypothetical protein F5H01DRAFT_348121 [Linnemannia elongata]